MLFNQIFPKFSTFSLKQNSTFLQIINFGDCLVRTEGARKIAASLQTSNPNLKELNLSFGEIRLSGGLKVCECMQSKENLKLLDLNGNQFGEDGCDDIQKLAENLKHGMEVLVELEDDEGDSDDEDDSEEEVILVIYKNVLARFF